MAAEWRVSVYLLTLLLCSVTPSFSLRLSLSFAPSTLLSCSTSLFLLLLRFSYLLSRLRCTVSLSSSSMLYILRDALACPLPHVNCTALPSATQEVSAPSRNAPRATRRTWLAVPATICQTLLSLAKAIPLRHDLRDIDLRENVTVCRK